MGNTAMANFKQLFMTYLDRNGINYIDHSEFVVKVTYTGDNLKSIPVYIFFDKDGDPMVQLCCWDIANFQGKEVRGMVACNDMNKKYRWVKFYVDKDSDIVVSTDAYIDEITCGDECLRLVGRIVDITDEAYPIFAQALWSE